MKKIILRECDNDTIWVSSDDNEIGTKVVFEKGEDEDKKMMISLAYFLGYDPAGILCIDVGEEV